jgi:tRNA (guanine26-N2/guanine27-N2)-dimethyltransferase
MLRTSPPELGRIIDRMAAEGKASRTHFSPTGFKTDLPLEDVRRLYLDDAR